MTRNMDNRKGRVFFDYWGVPKFVQAYADDSDREKLVEMLHQLQDDYYGGAFVLGPEWEIVTLPNPNQSHVCTCTPAKWGPN